MSKWHANKDVKGSSAAWRQYVGGYKQTKLTKRQNRMQPHRQMMVKQALALIVLLLAWALPLLWFATSIE